LQRKKLLKTRKIRSKKMRNSLVDKEITPI
jgi:hypothetical protein